MAVDDGLVFLSDTRTNAGVDHISTARKMSVFEQPGERLLVLLAAGNLSITQAVLHELSEPAAASEPTLWSVPTMADAARVVGNAVRRVHEREAEALQKFGVDFNCSFILGGQIGGNRMRLFMIYAAGNFIEAAAVNPYFQIGEAKYGKPIIDRVLTPSTALDEAAKSALISMDSTLRSNLSVGLPLDLLVYEKDALRVTRFVSIDRDNAYFDMIHRTWGDRLRQVFAEIPDPDWQQSLDAPSLQSERALVLFRAPVGADGIEHEQDMPPAQRLAQADKGKAQRR
jgi:putative proteasome-type protease